MTMPMAVQGACLPAPTLIDEVELIARLRVGDEDAYEELFRMYAGALLAVARRFFGDTDDAAEAVQDAFVSAFRSMKSFAGMARLGTWLHRITVNACLMKLRGRKRRRLVALDESIPQASRTDEDTLSRTETVAQVRASIAQLPDSYQTVIRLRDLEGVDTAETARRLGTSEAVVKTRLHRARHALKALLEPSSMELIV